MTTVFPRTDWDAIVNRDGIVGIRVILEDDACAGNWRSEQDMRDGLAHYLASATCGLEWGTDYRLTPHGLWRKAIDGQPSRSYREPSLSRMQATQLSAAVEARRLPRYGEEPSWTVWDVEPAEAFQALVLAGWVPTQAGIDLAQAARNMLDG